MINVIGTINADAELNVVDHGWYTLLPVHCAIGMAGKGNMDQAGNEEANTCTIRIIIRRGVKRLPHHEPSSFTQRGRCFTTHTIARPVLGAVIQIALFSSWFPG